MILIIYLLLPPWLPIIIMYSRFQILSKSPQFFRNLLLLPYPPTPPPSLVVALVALLLHLLLKSFGIWSHLCSTKPPPAVISTTIIMILMITWILKWMKTHRIILRLRRSDSNNHPRFLHSPPQRPPHPHLPEKLILLKNTPHFSCLLPYLHLQSLHHTRVLLTR